MPRSVASPDSIESHLDHSCRGLWVDGKKLNGNKLYENNFQRNKFLDGLCDQDALGSLLKKELLKKKSFKGVYTLEPAMDVVLLTPEIHS